MHAPGAAPPPPHTHTPCPRLHATPLTEGVPALVCCGVGLHVRVLRLACPWAVCGAQARQCLQHPLHPDVAQLVQGGRLQGGGVAQQVCAAVANTPGEGGGRRAGGGGKTETYRLPAVMVLQHPCKSPSQHQQDLRGCVRPVPLPPAAKPLPRCCRSLAMCSTRFSPWKATASRTHATPPAAAAAAAAAAEPATVTHHTIDNTRACTACVSVCSAALIPASCGCMCVCNPAFFNMHRGPRCQPWPLFVRPPAPLPPCLPPPPKASTHRSSLSRPLPRPCP